MKVYHQTGHNFTWNFDSYLNDKVGNGLILSPVNIDYNKIINLKKDLKNNSFFDPQFYLISDNKGKLETYNFFPGNIKDDFNTGDLEKNNEDIAKKCIQFQNDNDFKYIIIPARYHEQWPTKYYEEFYEFIILPFIKYYKKLNDNKKLLLTVIIKQNQILDDEIRNDLLSWITGLSNISGVYIIFENNFLSKQIKDTGYLFNVLKFIHILRENDLEVHIGYTNTEGILYSIANPNSVTMGSYENLRNYAVDRFITREEKQKRQSPRPRIYSGKLFQWIDYGYLSAIKTLYKKYNDLFEETKYKPLMFKPTFKWHFQKPELYKHYFIIFFNQISNLPVDVKSRIDYLINNFNNSIILFKDIYDKGIPLDSDSDGSHLNFWISVINMFKKYLFG